MNNDNQPPPLISENPSSVTAGELGETQAKSDEEIAREAASSIKEQYDGEYLNTKKLTSIILAAIKKAKSAQSLPTATGGEPAATSVLQNTLSRPTVEGWWWHRFNAAWTSWVPVYVSFIGGDERPQWLCCSILMMSDKANDWKGLWSGPIGEPSVSDGCSSDASRASSEFREALDIVLRDRDGLHDQYEKDIEFINEQFDGIPVSHLSEEGWEETVRCLREIGKRLNEIRTRKWSFSSPTPSLAQTRDTEREKEDLGKQEALDQR